MGAFSKMSPQTIIFDHKGREKIAKPSFPSILIILFEDKDINGTLTFETQLV